MEKKEKNIIVKPYNKLKEELKNNILAIRVLEYIKLNSKEITDENDIDNQIKIMKYKIKLLKQLEMSKIGEELDDLKVKINQLPEIIEIFLSNLQIGNKIYILEDNINEEGNGNKDIINKIEYDLLEEFYDVELLCGPYWEDHDFNFYIIEKLFENDKYFKEIIEKQNEIIEKINKCVKKKLLPGKELNNLIQKRNDLNKIKGLKLIKYLDENIKSRNKENDFSYEKYI